MADKVVITKSKITDIADAIRYKQGADVTDLMSLEDMKQNILDLPSGVPTYVYGELLCDIDFTSETPFYDKVRKIDTESFFASYEIVNNRLVPKESASTQNDIGVNLENGHFYIVELDCGEFDDTKTGYGYYLNSRRQTEFGYDTRYGWLGHGSTGTVSLLPVDKGGTVDAFDNKTIKIIISNTILGTNWKGQMINQELGNQSVTILDGGGTSQYDYNRIYLYPNLKGIRYKGLRIYRLI